MEIVLPLRSFALITASFAYFFYIYIKYRSNYSWKRFWLRWETRRLRRGSPRRNPKTSSFSTYLTLAFSLFLHFFVLFYSIFSFVLFLMMLVGWVGARGDSLERCRCRHSPILEGPPSFLFKIYFALFYIFYFYFLVS